MSDSTYVVLTVDNDCSYRPVSAINAVTRKPLDLADVLVKTLGDEVKEGNYLFKISVQAEQLDSDIKIKYMPLQEVEPLPVSHIEGDGVAA